MVSMGRDNIMFDKANQLYHNKNYDSAVRLYQQLINDGYCSPDLFYNAGNTYYRLNHVGLAVWCYKKALEIRQDKNYTDNLALAQKRIKEPIAQVKDIFFMQWWEKMYRLFSSNAWAMLALLGFLLGIAILIVNKLQTKFLIPRVISSLLFIFSGYTLIMCSVRSYNDHYHFKAIITEPEVMFTSLSNKEPIYIHEGIEVKVVDMNPKGNVSGMAPYATVRLPDGRVGKIDRRAMLKL
jgi:tetratricopeptide (TPR) repeat protein